MELFPTLRLSLPVPVHFLFILYLFFNIFLSWGPGMGPWRWGIGLLGLGLTWLWDIRGPIRGPMTIGKEVPVPFKIPGWTLGVVLGLAVALRFFRLTTLSVWPCYDDALWGWLAQRFEKTPGWPIFFLDSNFPSIHLWGLSFLFKWAGPSLRTLWAYPAALSALTVPVGYWAIRQFFSPFLSFLWTLFLALAFWPLFVGRFADQMVMVLLWECAYFGFLGLYIKKGARSLGGAFLMGAASVSGLYIFISCGPVGVFGALTLLFLWCSRKPFEAKAPVWFLGGALVLGLPLVLAGLGTALSSYTHVGAWGSSRPDLSIPFSYLTVLFWGADPAQGPYRPIGGGFLDPVLAAFIFLGIGELRARDKNLGLWIFSALVFFLFPGMVTNSLEPFRVLPVLVPLGLLCALGWERWLRAFKVKRAAWALILSTLAFAGLDQYQLQVGYGGFCRRAEGWKAYSRSPERPQAFDRLTTLASEKGPGLVFTNFLPGLTDVSLPLLDHPFNAVENPTLDPAKASWGAVLTNVNYRPFLAERFPQGTAYALSRGLDRPDGGLMLWVFPILGSQRPFLQKWMTASNAVPYQPHWDPSYQLPELLKARATFEGDPFLLSSYWEKVSDLIFRSSNFQDPGDAQDALAQALQKGFPAAHLFWRKAVFEEILNKPRDAFRDYRSAHRSLLDLTRSSLDLERLKEIGP